MRSACLLPRLAVASALLLASALPSKARQAATLAERADTQAWVEVDVTLPVSERLELTWVSFARLSSEIGRAVMYANGLYADVAIGDHLTLTPFYNQYHVYGYTTGQWARTGEPGFDFTVAGGSPQCQLSDRSRLYHVLGGTTSPWVYRNRPRIECRVGSGPHDLGVFVSDEFFHYSTFGGWTRYRLMSGARMTLNKRCAIDMYYVRQVDQRQIPGTINALGLTFELRVGKLQ